MPTLREFKDLGYEVRFFCTSARGPFCHHSWRPSWDQLIQYLGPDFDMTGGRHIIRKRFVCEACGQRGAIVHITPGPTTRGMGGPGGAHEHAPASPSILAQLSRDSETVEAKLTEQLREVAQYRAQRRAKAKAKKAIDTGKDLIGPPSPFGPGKVRPKMKR